jgi:hypothetical protein
MREILPFLLVVICLLVLNLPSSVEGSLAVLLILATAVQAARMIESEPKLPTVKE